MGLIQLSRPWTEQPQGGASVDPHSASAAKLVFADLLGPASIDVVSGRLGAVVGTKQTPVAGGVLRSFGATIGVDANDRVRLPLTSHSDVRSWVFRYRMRATSASGLGRIFTKGTAAEVEFFADNNSAFPSTLAYSRAFSTTTGVWRWARPALGRIVTVVLTYDASSTANAPELYYDGVKQSRTTTTTPSGTATTNSGEYGVGNRLTDNARVFDGSIGDLFIVDRIVSDAEAAAIGAAPWPYFLANRRVSIFYSADAAGGLPTLSNARVTGVTTTTATPLVDYTY